MLRPLLGSLVVLAGCAEISGLGALEVCDGACVDALADDVTAQQADGTAKDSSTTSDVTTELQPIDAIVPPPDGPIVSDASIDSPQMQCGKPTDCSQNDLCCATISTQGQYPQCTIASVSTKCTATCPSSIQLQKCGTDIAHLCTTNQDCTEQTYNRCCTFPYGNKTLEICTNIALADAGGATCQ